MSRRSIPRKANLDRLQNAEYAQNGAFFQYQTLERRRFVMALIHNETISPERKVAIIQGWIKKGYVYPLRVDAQTEEPHLTLKSDASSQAHIQQNSFWR